MSSLRDQLNRLDDMFRFDEGKTIAQSFEALEVGGYLDTKNVKKILLLLCDYIDDMDLSKIKQEIISQDEKIRLFSNGANHLTKEMQEIRKEIFLLQQDRDIKAKKPAKN